MKRKNCSALALLWLALFCLWPGCGSCSETLTPTQDTVTMSKADLMTLTENNRKQRQALKQSETALLTASSRLNASQEALTKAKTQLNESNEQIANLQAALTASQSETATLRQLLTQQKAETETLRQNLNELQQASENASESIVQANKSLQNTREEFRKNDAAHAKAEKRLKRQKTAWQIVAVFLGGAAIFK